MQQNPIQRRPLKNWLVENGIPPRENGLRYVFSDMG
jgi:hypothetical protein